MESNEKIEMVRDNLTKNAEHREMVATHYHGEKVRNIFIAMAGIMIVVTPFIKDELNFSAYLSIFGIISLSMIAGFIRPKFTSMIALSFISSVAAVALFGYESISSYGGTHSGLFFFFNIVLALLSFLALYFSSKTLRGVLLS